MPAHITNKLSRPFGDGDGSSAETAYQISTAALSTSSLTGGSTTGTWVWSNETIIPTAGTYPIVPSGAAASENYAIQYQNGTLTVSALSKVCDVISITSPSGAAISGTNISGTVANSISSQLIGVTVSMDAAWALYSDASCTSEITNKVMTLFVGVNTAYIKVAAEDGTTSKIYTVIITRSASTGGGGSSGGGSRDRCIDHSNSSGFYYLRY